MEKYMRNIKMTIEYDGGKYKGWQRQKSSDLTIQGKLEDVLSRMTEEELEVIGSGRTDAGVHAMNQIANFWTNSEMPLDMMVEYCYRYLPEDIVVKNAEEVPELFHSRYNAVSKTYLYKICYRKHHDVFNRKYSYHIDKQPNIEEMVKASSFLIGEYDFKSFTSLKSKKKSTVRKIYSIDISKNLGYIEINITGNGFLQSMVRIIIGTLLEVGYGNVKAAQIKEILKKKDRSLAGPPAPAHGLFLKEVKY
jgi:tRNA pseudouridine38-40 synthase